MTNQNWILQAHYHAQTGHTAVQLANLQSGTVTDASGSSTSISQGNFPVYRLIMKLAFETSSMSSTSYLTVRMGGNTSSWDNYILIAPDNYTQYSNQYIAQYTTSTGNSFSGLNMGSGTLGSQYSGYGWGSTVTATDGTSVTATDRKRWCYTNIEMNTYHQNSSWYPGGVSHSAAVYNGAGSGNQTGETNSGSFSIGMAGTSNSASFNDVYISSSYYMYGDFLLYRSAIGNYVGGS